MLDPTEPSITALELVGADYRQLGRVSGSEQLALTEPFPMALDADALGR